MRLRPLTPLREATERRLRKRSDLRMPRTLVSQVSGPELLGLIEQLVANRKSYESRQFWRLYKILRRQFYLSREWRTLSRQVRKDQPWCSHNKRHKSLLHAHHIKRLYTHPWLGLVKSNISVICSRCHKLEHRRG